MEGQEEIVHADSVAYRVLDESSLKDAAEDVVEVLRNRGYDNASREEYSTGRVNFGEASGTKPVGDGEIDVVARYVEEGGEIMAVARGYGLEDDRDRATVERDLREVADELESRDSLEKV